MALASGAKEGSVSIVHKSEWRAKAIPTRNPGGTDGTTTYVDTRLVALPSLPSNVMNSASDLA